MTGRRRHLAASAVLALHCSGVSVVAWPGRGSSYGDAASLISPQEWAAEFQSPNATGSVSIGTLPDVSRPPTGQGDAGGWTLSIAVKADIPVPASTTNATTAGYTTGTEITLTAPDSLLVKNGTGPVTVRNDPVWLACIYLVSNLTGHAFTNGSSAAFDPTCAQLLPPGCSDDLHGQLDDADVNYSQDCPNLSLPKSCRSAFDTNFDLFGQETNMNYFNGSPIYNVADESHQLGNAQPYSDAVHNGWLVVSMMAYQNRSAAQNGTSSQNGTTSHNTTQDSPPPVVQLSCIRPDTVTAGSQLPSLGVRMSASAVVTFIIAGTAAWFLAM